MLSCVNSQLSTNKRQAAVHLPPLSLHDHPPRIMAVVGESGSGKTTLARLLLGLETPTEGEVLYRGCNIHAMNKSERRQFLHDVQFVFQDPYPAADFLGCKFANRCPHVMDRCLTHQPPLYQTEEHRVVSCYLYQENASTLDSAGLEKVFITQPTG